MAVKKHRSPWSTAFLWICLIGYILLLLKVTLFKFDHDTVISILNDTDELEFTRVNLVPFQTIRFYLFSHRVASKVAVRNLAGNVLAFVPIGILVPLLRRNLSLGLTFLVGFGLSAFIETAQYITGLGSADVDDIILNVLGSMLITILLFLGDLLLLLGKKLKKSRKGLDKKSRRE